MVPAASGAPGWTRPADVLAQLRRRWQAGTFLAAFAVGQPWEPLGIGIRAPSARELAEHFAEVQAWAAQWEGADRTLLRVEHRQIGGRLIGSNAVPCRVWMDSYEQLWTLLGVRPQVRRFTELAAATAVTCPALTEWMAAHPVRVLGLAEHWPALAATVTWIDQRQRPGMYLRQVDVPGVDTKFIERHRGILAELLDLQLDAGRIDSGVPRSDFAGRYLFRVKPEYVRFRLPPGSGARLAGSELTELSTRTAEFAAAPPGITSAYVVENEITYLAFPPAPEAMVIFGGGYAASVLESLGWLAGLRLIYWGDIDTHGFAILNRLRQRFGHVSSMLMDRATLLEHRSQWVTEPAQLDAALDGLDADEAALYRELLSGAHGPSVRLEQERISFAAIERALLGQLTAQQPGVPAVQVAGYGRIGT
jgi:hypothetical protein